MMRATTLAIARLARNLAGIAVETVLDAGCPVCDTALHRARGGICGTCWQELAQGAWGTPSFVVGTDIGGTDIGGTVGGGTVVAGTVVGLDSLTTLGPYEGRLKSLIRSIKYAGLAGAAEPLGEILIDRASAVAAQIDLVVPVPLHWRRRWSRGYNQAERIARGVAAHAGLPVRRLAIRRSGSGRAQTGLDRAERLVNVSSAFRASARAVSGRRLLLVDDVVTTGATMRACARALRTAGAVKVHGAAAARAGGPGPESRDDGRIET